jgi:hypothetical protein
MIKDEEQAWQKQDKQSAEAMVVENTVTKIQPPMSEIMQDIEEITTRQSKDKKDFQNI